jgi:Na+/H+ antiporter NhaD/arsenite permease-like protein
METIEYFSDFLRKIGAPNFLAIGIVITVIWLLVSGLRKGLKRGGDKRPQENEENKKKVPLNKPPMENDR